MGIVSLCAGTVGYREAALYGFKHMDDESKLEGRREAGRWS
jgi:hypothetical protein